MPATGKTDLRMCVMSFAFCVVRLDILCPKRQPQLNKAIGQETHADGVASEQPASKPTRKDATPNQFPYRMCH
jgi:hypothetical protein